MSLVAFTLAFSAPFQAPGTLLEPPPGWGRERLEFPLSFAPELAHEGFEELAFSPGMFAPDSDSYFSYALALRLEGELVIDEAFLDSFLETYYRGLCRAVAGERGLTLDLAAISAEVRREGSHFRARISMFDAFVTGKPLELALELEAHAAPRATEILGLASPLDTEAPVWEELHALGARWRAARPVPVLLNHVFFVVERATYDALTHSEFLRTFAVTEERETVRGDGSYTGFYLYGRNTYFEFLPPGAAGMSAGSTGLALGLETAHATDELAQRLGEHGVRSQAFPISRALEGETLPWFRLLGMEMPSAALTVFTMEYDPGFLARWHSDLAPAHPGLARADVLERYAASLDAAESRASQPFADVREVRLALDDAQRERLLAVCAASGYELEERDAQHVVHAPGFRLVLGVAASPGGITGLELALSRPLAREPLELGQVTLSFHARGASLVLRP
ncbi:MAG: hypothetical protein HOP15_15550 [Planctomycetes bacterium]|nr:hypothetical protein [Planctomycetota bacterium]